MIETLSKRDVLILAEIIAASIAEKEVCLIVEGEPHWFTARQIFGEAPDIRDQQVLITENSGARLTREMPIRDLLAGYADTFIVVEHR